MDQYGVMGNPIQHSKSPKIHQAFANQTEQQMSYQAIWVPLDGFNKALDLFQAEGGKGLNITLPFKQQAYQSVDVLSERAKLAKAVNTIQFHSDGSRFGDNTDGVGFIQDVVHRHQFSIANKRVLILGAGGAVRGILDPLLQERPAELMIANRTVEHAHALADAFSNDQRIHVCSLLELGKFTFDFIINGTSASLTNDVIELPFRLIHEKTYCYDMVYGKGLTPFMTWAKQNQAAKISDGLGMLIEQAAESFYIWRGVRPNTHTILNYIASCD